jgi:hypothetical protein
VAVTHPLPVPHVDQPEAELQAYEERSLFLLLLLPGIIISHARARLHPMSPNDGDTIPLTVKLLQRPRLLEQIRSLVPDPDHAHLVPFNT